MYALDFLVTISNCDAEGRLKLCSALQMMQDCSEPGCGRLRAMIVYFTGTGNSLAAARRFAERTGDLFA